MSKSAPNAHRTRIERASNTPRTRAKNVKNTPEKPEIPAESSRVRFAFVPTVREFRRHTKQNQARLWIPVETSLLVRYEFASCSLQTRYVFVAIVLYCGANGIEEIPLDAKFMSSVLVADERTVMRSLKELLGKKLLVEREQERKEKTDRQPDKNGVVCVDSPNLFQNEAENQADLSKQDLPRKNLSQFSIEECLKYVELCKSDGETVKSPKALANHLFKTGEADSFITATLYPAKQKEVDLQTFGEPRPFSAKPCSICYGAKMADVDDKGFRACQHCKNEKGKSTGFEPESGNS